MKNCTRCTRPLTPGDLVVDVRVVTTIYDLTLATDRGDGSGDYAYAHVTCPEPVDV